MEMFCILTQCQYSGHNIVLHNLAGCYKRSCVKSIKDLFVDSSQNCMWILNYVKILKNGRDSKLVKSIYKKHLHDTE